MQRLFLVLAVCDGSLLGVVFMQGLLVPHRQGGAWHDIHFLFGLLSVLTTLLLHSVVFTYFLGTTRWVREVVRVYRMPDWVWAQAVKNKRRAFPFEFWSMFLIGLTACLGAAADTRYEFDSTWHLGTAAVTIAFNLGAFVAEYVAIVQQARLVLEVKGQADTVRVAQESVDDRSRDQAGIPQGVDGTSPIEPT